MRAGFGLWLAIYKLASLNAAFFCLSLFGKPSLLIGSSKSAIFAVQGGTVSSKTSSGNSQLRKRKNGGNSEEGNVYYNGNSTEFKGNDDS